ncbi:uncharacterized protein DDB_G0287625-like [Pistacia vera]|uniref:uncharacterized protein DDB_G0287625-like n=1 Tax=Pistacia vera TaxID=55513 RepID=UPI0012635EDC|nr:uncharacterized protein DDB_G0287625-like [Pistacia vera]
MVVSSAKSKNNNSNNQKKTRTSSKNNNTKSGAQTRRSKSPGVRLIGRRIYDSQNGKTCHQESAKSGAKICGEVDGFQRPRNSKVHLKPSELHGAGVETRSSKVKRLRDNNRNENASGDNKDAEVKLSDIQDVGVKTRSSKLKRLRYNNGNENVTADKKDAQVKILEIWGAGLKTRSSKLKRLRDSNGNENVSGDDKDAQVKLSNIQGAEVKTRSGKMIRLRSNNGNENVSADKKDVQVKLSEIQGAGEKTRSRELKRLRDSNGNENVSRDNKDAQVKLSDTLGAGVKTRNSKLKRLRDNNGNENVSGDKDTQVKLLEIQVAGVKTRSSKLKRLRDSNGNENVSGDNKDVQVELSEILGAGVKTRSRKLKTLQDGNWNVNVSVYSKDAQVKLSEMQGAGVKTRRSKLKRLRDNKDADSVAQKSSPKSHQRSKGIESDSPRPSNSMGQAKYSKIEGTGIEIRSSKFKRLRDNKGGENVSGEKNDATSNTEKSNTKRRQNPKGASRGKEEIFHRDHGGRLIRMNSDMKTPEKDFQDSINYHSETELNNLDIDDTVAENKPLTGSDGHEKKNIVEVKRKFSNKEISLPCGIILNNVASVDIPAEDVGHAFQFLEFCQAFGQILNLGKGRSELLLRELVCGRSKRRVCSSPIAQFHIQLLSLIQKNSGKGYPYFHSLSENSWVQVLFRYVSESHFSFKELQVDCFEVADYDQLDISKKLKLLNFLCDEALGTTDFRSWIDGRNSKFVQREKKLKEKVLGEEEKMKNMKKNKKLQDKIAKACLVKNGAPLSISEHADLVSKIKLKAAQTLSRTVEASEAMVNVSKEELRSDALRLEPMFLDGHGHKFWRLRCYSAEMKILLQGTSSLLDPKFRGFHFNRKFCLNFSPRRCRD